MLTEPYRCPECRDDNSTVLRSDYGPHLIIECQACRLIYGADKPVH